ncbi:MAG: hypothetical protein A2Z93_00710 [Curvibacter sp. GWA2_64_110]|nr:MAG: hypothetical protein A2Z93_00710 [Curvibacter sp. GWA2_64_110]HCY17055.1 hypothetical protein [Curvibacter sp.]
MSSLSRTQCHDQRQGQHLDGTVIPPTHLNDVCAQPCFYGAQEWVTLELNLIAQARGQVLESPAVRP